MQIQFVVVLLSLIGVLCVLVGVTDFDYVVFKVIECIKKALEDR
jgi:hypothetical protein